MLWQILVAVFVSLVVSTLLYYKWKFQYWRRKDVFTFPPQFPFGNATNIFLSRNSLGMEMYNLYKQLRARNLSYGGYYITVQPIFVPVDINLIRDMLTTDFQYFTDHNGPMDEKNDPLSGHLFALTGAKWKALRIKLTPTFTTGKLKTMFKTLVDCTEGLPVLLDEAERRNEAVDIKEIFARYTTDVIASVAFGIECNCLKNPNAEFRKWGKRILELDTIDFTKRIIQMMIPSLYASLGLTVFKKDVTQFFINLVKETADYRDKNKIERKDFMQLLLNLRDTALKVESRTTDNNGEVSYYQNGLTLTEIAAQAFVFFLAGYETSSTTLNFLMYELANHPEIQDKLRKEVVEVLAKYNGELTYEALGEMTYLDKCLLETLRKHPAVPVLPRECTKDYRIPNTDTVIKKQTLILIPTYGIHHDPEYYPDPEKFDPERFSDENKGKQPPMTYLAFGEGPRICIGLRLGVLQTKVGLVAMLKKYSFTLNPKTQIPLQYSPLQNILTVKEGIWVDAHKL